MSVPESSIDRFAPEPGAQEDVREADARWALTVATAQRIKAVTFISW